MGPAWGRQDNNRVGPLPLRLLQGKAVRKPGCQWGNTLSPETLKRSNPNKAALSLEEIPSAQRPSTQEEQGGFLISVPGSDV